MECNCTKSEVNIYLACRKKAAVYNDKLNSREMAAELLGISVSTLANYEGTEKYTIFILTLIKKEKNHQNFYDSGGFFVRRNINCLFFRRKFLFFIH